MTSKRRPTIMRDGYGSGMIDMVELVDDEPDQHAPGAKLDAGKPRVALVLAKALSDLIDQDSTEGRLLKLLIEELNDH